MTFPEPYDDGAFAALPGDTPDDLSVSGPALPGVDMTGMETTGTGANPAPDGTEIRFGSGGYSGSYNGISDCWFSNDGYVYAPDGTRIGAC